MRRKEDACQESLISTEQDVLLANEAFAPLAADERVKFLPDPGHVLPVFGHPLPNQKRVFHLRRQPVPMGGACARRRKTKESRATPQINNIVNVRDGGHLGREPPTPTNAAVEGSPFAFEAVAQLLDFFSQGEHALSVVSHPLPK